MAIAIRIPKLILRNITHEKKPNLNIIEARPQITVPDCMLTTTTTTNTTPRSKFNRRDRLYFKLQDIFNSRTTNSGSILEFIYNNLNNEIKTHFHPLNTLSVKWWNLTHYYIYSYSDVTEIIRQIIEREAFLVKKIDLYDVV